MRDRERRTAGPEETEAIGEALGRVAAPGDVLGLTGELGAGKTCLVRGLARGLGVDSAIVHSPTFVMMTEYPGGRLPLHHVDLYRLEGPVDDPAVREVLDARGVVAIEWAERLAPPLADDLLRVAMRHGRDDERFVTFRPSGPRSARWLATALGA